MEPQQGDVLALFEEGNRRFRAGDYAAALYYHDRCVQLSPQNPQYLCSVARDHAALGQAEQAYRMCRRALEADPNYAYAVEFMRKLGYTPPLQAFHDAKEAGRSHPSAAVALEAAHRRQLVNDLTPPEARVEGTRQGPALNSILQAYTAYTAGQLHDAWYFCTAAVAIEPFNSYAYYLRGAIEEKRLAITSARQDYEHAFRLGRRAGGIKQRLLRVHSPIGS